MFFKRKSSQGTKNTIFVNRFNCGGHIATINHWRTDSNRMAKPLARMALVYENIPVVGSVDLTTCGAG